MKPPRHIADNTRLKGVYDLLYSQIAAGEFKAGERLPTEQELATRVGCSATTVATAMRMLVKEGLIERRKRAGTFVQNKTAPKTKTSFLGAIIFRAMPIYANNIFVPISQEIGHQAELAGHGFVVHDPGYRTEQTSAEVAANLDRMTKKLIDLDAIGVFVLPQEIEDGCDESLSSKAIAKLTEAKIPVVLLDRDIYRFPRRSKYDLVSIDNLRAGYVVTEHLLSLGRKRIDFLSASTYSSAGRDRLEGYKRALQAHGIDPASRTVHLVDHYDDETFQQVLRSDADAIVAVRDGLASHMLHAALMAKRRVPEDLSIVGFDDLPQSRYLVPPLTTIRQPAIDFGQHAVATMFERIKHPERGPVDVRVGFDLIVRRSCGAPVAGKK
jgi:GntR family transcriptional regulator, arabinose operon transcriptional repressor